MAVFTPDQLGKILQALQQKMKRGPWCQSCGEIKWAVVDGLVYFPLSVVPSNPSLAATQGTGQALPSIATVCSTCGHTTFYNVFWLGVAEILGMSPGVVPVGR